MTAPTDTRPIGQLLPLPAECEGHESTAAADFGRESFCGGSCRPASRFELLLDIDGDVYELDLENSQAEPGSFFVYCVSHPDLLSFFSGRDVADIERTLRETIEESDL
jgi:hypothetical protein